MALPPNNLFALLEGKDIYYIRKLNYAPDPAVVKILNTLSTEYQENADKTFGKIKQGHSLEIQKVTERLNGTNLVELDRLLLSNINIYADLLSRVCFKKGEEEQKENVPPADTLGVVNQLKKELIKERSKFLDLVVKFVLEKRKIQLGVNFNADIYKRLIERVVRDGIPLRGGKIEPAIMALLSNLSGEGDFPKIVKDYLIKQGFGEDKIEPSVVKNMSNYLLKLGLPKEVQDIDEPYLALAYQYAMEKASGTTDPLDASNTKGAVAEWDFRLDTFDTFDDQVVIPDNIKAAGALYYNYFIGEVMRAYAIADALVLRWASAALDIPDGQTAAALYRYYKKRDDRSTPEERGMLYKRVFNIGEAELLSRMVVNEEFEGLWFRLMSEVTDYIHKQEDNSSDNGRISRTPIYQATKELQYNLTEHMTGMAHLQVTEMHAHLQEAIELLQSEDVIDHFGGRRKNMFRVIERVAAEDMNATIPTSLIRTMAVEGAAVLQNWVASFNQQTYTEDQFQGLLDSAQAWIIAQASMEGNGQDSDQADTDSEAEDKSDFSDWES